MDKEATLAQEALMTGWRGKGSQPYPFYRPRSVGSYLCGKFLVHSLELYSHIKRVL